MPSSNAHPVAFFIYPGVASYDVAGPAQAFAVAGTGLYGVQILSLCGGLVDSDCPGLSFGSLPSGDMNRTIGTLVLPGGLDAPTVAANPDMIAEVKRLAALAERIACVCTGAFLAAEAGLLGGRRAATHWRYCDQFADRFRDVRLDRDSIWVRDGHVWSSAGVSAGVDLALALIEEDHDGAMALRAARELVVFLKRPGGQSQFSTVLSAQLSDVGGPLGPLMAWVADHLHADLRSELLAQRAGMSPRSFARTFVARMGMTPAKAIELMRVESARDAIERTDTPFGVIAARCGFGAEQRMRHAFVRQFGANPADIRARFSA